MPSPAPLKQKITATPDIPAAKCVVEEREGGAVVHFRIDPQTWARLSRKMGSQDPAVFLWENILHRAVEGAAY